MMDPPTNRARSPAREAMAMFARSRVGMIGLGLLAVILLVSLAGPMILVADPFDIAAAPLTQPWTSEAWLGTDQQGRDVLTGLIHGGRATLAVGATAACISVLIGIAVGALAGYFGGAADEVLMRLTEFFQVLPALLFAMVVASLFPPSLTTIALAIGVVSWPSTARLTRAEFLRLKQLDFVAAE